MAITLQSVKTTIGNNLKEVRQRLGLSHVELAELSSISKGSIIKIEQGEKGYTIDSLLLLTHTLGYTLSEIGSEKTIIPEYAALRVKIHHFYSQQGNTPPGDLFQKQDKRIKNLVLSQILPSKFLNKGRLLNEILHYCKNELGITVKSTTLSNTLKRLADKGVIDISKSPSKDFKYRKARKKNQPATIQQNGKF